jgi:hypothetical protein
MVIVVHGGAKKTGSAEWAHFRPARCSRGRGRTRAAQNLLARSASAPREISAALSAR